MKVCLVSFEYPPYAHVGGIGTYTLALSKVLLSNNCSVEIITYGPKNEIRQDGLLKVHHLKLLPYYLP